VIVYVLQGMTLGLSASASPGPLQFYLLSHAMAHGWRRALPAAAAPLVSDVVIVTVVLFLLTRLPPQFLNVLQVIGAIFILYLAWGAYQSFKDEKTLDRQVIAESDGAPPLRGVRWGFTKAILMNFLSPGPYVFWSTILGPIVLKAWGESAGLAVVFVGGFYGAMIGLNGLLVVLFSKASEIGPKVARAFQGIAIVGLVVFGIYQLWTGITGIIPLM